MTRGSIWARPATAKVVPSPQRVASSQCDQAQSGLRQEYAALVMIQMQTPEARDRQIPEARDICHWSCQDCTKPKLPTPGSATKNSGAENYGNNSLAQNTPLQRGDREAPKASVSSEKLLIEGRSEGQADEETAKLPAVWHRTEKDFPRNHL
ncbi:hypothetical protein NDU88_002179 [Pleurodeles waltl]|uniref:Uncharacterized protein n=1 Tax=Pleurodeles waltl TaxID=8319 RepID=A0AAV7KUV5_PLEWA|nr:hypothetical protein NDU88_002179 [Pleurodeles waltl]